MGPAQALEKQGEVTEARRLYEAVVKGRTQLRSGLGPIWAHMGPYGPLWALMGSYGPLWAHMGPPGQVLEVPKTFRKLSVRLLDQFRTFRVQNLIFDQISN